MIQYRPLFLSLSIVLFVSVLTACADAGGGETGTGIKESQNSTDNNDGKEVQQNISITTISTGIVTKLTKIEVNKVQYDIDASTSTVTIDGKPANKEDLALGMVVTVHGNINDDELSGQARKVEFHHEVIGVINNRFEPDANGMTTLIVLGQTVYVNADCQFSSEVVDVTDIQQLTDNHVIAISGFTDGSGQIYATRIVLIAENYSMDDTFEIRGLMVELDYPSSTFQLKNLTIDYANANIDADANLTLKTLIFNDGLYVNVSGTLREADNILIADQIDLLNNGAIGIDVQQGIQVIVQGVLTPDKTIINGQPIQLITEFNSPFEPLPTGGTELPNEDIPPNILYPDFVLFKGEINEQGNLTGNLFEGEIDIQGNPSGNVTN